MTLTDAQVSELRTQFPSLARQQEGREVVYFDGPAGTQVPRRVIDAITGYLTHHNANHAGQFATSRESDRLLERCHAAVADLLGSPDPDTVVFGGNMTTLTFALSRALARTWRAGDEIVLSRLEHDANFTPWVLAAEDAGVQVRYADVNPDDCTLRVDQYETLINDRTRLVAVGCASNAVGSINPVAEICAMARRVGALSFLDAVHCAPHDLIDVANWDCDFLACSAYKFFGPHVGILYGKRDRLESIRPYKLRPCTEQLPGRWMTGTQNHECIAGTMAAIDYLADIGREVTGDDTVARRQALASAFRTIRSYESRLVSRLLEGLSKIPGIKIWGITDPDRLLERMPTVAITSASMKSIEVAGALGDQGIYVWHGNYYALPLTERIGVEPDGMVRIGIVHYNTADEVDRLLDAITKLGR